MRPVLAALLFLTTIFPHRGASPNPAASDKPFVVEYYYKTKWGHADEFLKLFKKNHYPMLKKEVGDGANLKVWVDQPRYHTTEDGRWDFRVTIVFKNATVANEAIRRSRPAKATVSRIRKRSSAKSSAVSKSSTPTGICPSKRWI